MAKDESEARVKAMEIADEVGCRDGGECTDSTDAEWIEVQECED
jgi:hypothetical protein